MPPEKAGDAASLINVARNLGGSIGISLAGTALARSTQVHQSHITAQLVPSSPAFQEVLQTAIAQFSRTAGRPDAQQRAYALTEQIVQRQATLMSYIDVLAGYAIVAALLVPIAFLLLRPARGAPAGH